MKTIFYLAIILSVASSMVTIEKLLEKDEFENWFKVVGNEHPMLLKLAIAKYISIETFSILNLLTNFIPDWDKKIKEKFVKASKADIKIIRSFKTLKNLRFIEFPKSGLKILENIIKIISFYCI